MADDVFAGLDPIVQKTAAPVPAADPEPAPFAGLEPITARQEGEWRGQRPEDSDVTWGDWGRGLAAGTVNIASGMAALTEFMTGGNLGHDRRKELEQTSQGIMAGASPEFRRATEASWTGGEGPGVLDVGIGRSLAAQLVQTLPSLVTTVIPAGMAGTLARGLGASIRTGAMVGAGVARAAEGAQDSGATAQQIMNSVEAIPDKELQAQSPQYRGYRAEMDEATARQHYNRDVMGVLPLVAGAISTALGGQGVEAGVARMLAGKDTKAGLVRGVLKGFMGEGIQEAGQNAGQEASAQAALSQAGLSDASWQKIIEQAVQGFVVGGAMGVPGGAAIGAGERIRRKIQANKDSAAEAGVTGTGHGSNRDEGKDTQGAGQSVVTTENGIDPTVAAALPTQTPAPEVATTLELAQSPPGPAPQAPTPQAPGMGPTPTVTAPEAQAAPGAAPTEATNAAPAVAPEAQATAPEVTQAGVAPPQAAPEAAAPVGAVAAPAPDAVGQAVDVGPVNTAPTEAQKKAGNYAKGHVKFGGLDITIENPTGSERTGVGADGKAWSTTMPAHYGYIKRTEGADGDHVDVYLADKPIPGHVYVVDQVDPATGKFDEHKVILGVPSKAKAQALYEAGFSDGSGAKRMGAITYMKPGDFKEWLKTGDQTKPLGKAKPVKGVKAPKAAKPEEVLGKNEQGGNILAPRAEAEVDKHATEHAVRAEDETKAKELFDKFPPTEIEQNEPLSGKGIEALRERITSWLQAAHDAGVKVPGKWATHGNELGFLAEVGALAESFANTDTPVDHIRKFISKEYSARDGLWDEVRGERKAAGVAKTEAKAEAADLSQNPLANEKEGAERMRSHARGSGVDREEAERDQRLQVIHRGRTRVRTSAENLANEPSPVEQRRAEHAATAEDIAAYRAKQIAEADRGIEGVRIKQLGMRPKVTGKISLGPKGAAAVQDVVRASSADRAERNPLFDKLKRLVGIKEFHAGDKLKASDVASYVMRRAGAASALTGNPLHQAILPALAERLAKLLGDMDVIIVTPQAMRNLGVGDANGVYHSGEHAVYLTDEVINNAIMGPRVVVHELVHAAFMNATWSNHQIRRDVENLMKVVWDAYPELRHIHAFDNIDEFITEAFTSPEFQEWLAHTPIPPGLRTGRSALASRISSLWDWLAAKVGEALGITGVQQSILGEMMRVGHRLELAALAHPPGPLKGYAREFANSAPSAEQLFSKRGRPEFPGGARASHADDIVARVGDVTVGASLKTRAAAMAMSSVDQIRQWYRHLFADAKGNALEEMIGTLQKMGPWANAKRVESGLVAAKFFDYAKQLPERAAAFAQLAIRATMLNVNLGEGADNGHLGQKAWWGVQPKKHLPELNRLFAQFTPEEKKLWGEMTTFFRATQNEIATELASNILDLLDNPVSPANRAALIDRVAHGNLQESDKLLIDNPVIFKSLKEAREVRAIDGVYFPLMRHGDWVVTYTDKIKDLMGGKLIAPDTVEFRADTEKAARALADKYMEETPFTVLDMRSTPDTGPKIGSADDLPGAFGPMVQVSPGTAVDYGFQVKVQLKGVDFFDSASDAAKFIRTESPAHDAMDQEPQPRKSTGHNTGDLQGSQLASLVSSIEQRFNKPEQSAQKEMMITAIHQAAARMMSGNRVQQRSLTRRNVMGASTDFARNLEQYGQATSRYLAKIKFMPEVRDAMQHMRDIAAAQPHDAGNGARVAVMNELNKRLEQNVVGLKEPSKWIQRVKTLTYMNKLVGPSWNVINSMQPSLVTYPYLAGRYGLMKAGVAISNSYSAVGGRGIVGMGLTNTAATIRQYARTAAETGDIIAFIRKNLSAAPDGAALVKAFNYATERGALDENSTMMIDAAISGGSNAFDIHLSKVDRAARQLALAIEAMNRSTTLVATYRLAIAAGKTAEQAVQEAFDTVQNTQGDYSAMNAPAAFNHPVWGMSLQFKKYAQMMYALLGDMLYRSFKGASAEEKAVARKQLAVLVGTQILAAGALGIPGAELIKLSFMAAGALGIGGGYDDWERKVRAFLAHQLGAKTAELLTKGIIPHAFGLDLSSRIGMDTLLTFGEPRRYEEDPSWAWMARTVAGAPFGVVADQFIAARAFAEGEGWKGVEHLPMPKFVVDAAKAVDHMTNAKHSARTGKETAPAIGPVTAGVNFLGFKTAGQEEQSASGGAKFAVREQITNEGRALTKMRNEFAEAKTEGERVKVLARLKEWNKGKSADEQKSPADLKKFAKRYQEDKAKGLTDSGFRARNDAEMKRIKDAASPYGV